MRCDDLTRTPDGARAGVLIDSSVATDATGFPFAVRQNAPVNFLLRIATRRAAARETEVKVLLQAIQFARVRSPSVAASKLLPTKDGNALARLIARCAPPSVFLAGHRRVR